jgi:ABC-type multidrug transport system ATPase subunit
MENKILDLKKLSEGESIIIGREDTCDLVINDPDVSTNHAKILAREDGIFVRDLESRKGVSLNDAPVSGLRRLRSGDMLSIAGHNYKVTVPEKYSDPGAGLIADKISVERKNKKILKDLSLSVEAGEFVGIVGPSGCGKSTLMGVLAGTIEASSGNVLINGTRCNSAELKDKTGFLPQFLVTHSLLSVEETLDCARKIFPGAALPSSDAITMSGLEGKEKQLVKTLSGGQQKRAGLAQELLFQPDLLCLDEVTSGLDPSSEKDMMVLFRKLSDTGKTVLCITHYPERLALCDKLVVLMDGFMIFCGSPHNALKHFDIPSLAELYDKMRERKAEDWLSKYKQDEAKLPQEPEPAYSKSSYMRPVTQFFPLLFRYLKTWLRAPAEMLCLFLQGIIIGLLVGLCFGAPEADIIPADEAARAKQILFSLILAAIWIGATTSVREIVKERRIIIHEGRRRLSALACVMSKFFTLTFFSCVGVFLLCVIVLPWTKLQVNAPLLIFSLLLTTAVSVALALLVSALCTTQEKALTILPVIIIALALFSGGIQKLKGPSLFAGKCCYSYWAFDTSKHSLSTKILNAPNPDFIVVDWGTRKEVKGQRVIGKPEKLSSCLILNIFYGALFLLLAAFGVKRTIKKG